MCENHSKAGFSEGILKAAVGEDAERIQERIDVDKYNKSMVAGYDLCGTYAPFCGLCNKSAAFPCAEAYLQSCRTEELASDGPQEPVSLEAAECAAEPEEVEGQAEQPKRKIRIAYARKKGRS